VAIPGSSKISRRSFLATAAALGAAAAWAVPRARRSEIRWTERRDAYPEGVASGDPFSESVILWTRHPAAGVATLTVEVAEDEAFTRVVAHSSADARPDLDWTCRVLVGGLKPRTTYWYRFANAEGAGSRIGRTRTAPLDHEDYRARFVFTSCQDVTSGAQNAYRRMIYEDERAGRDQQIDFLFHQGDFIYEVVNYPRGSPKGLLRPAAARCNSLSARGEDSGFSYSGNLGRLSHGLPGLPSRSGFAGCASPLAVRQYVG